MMLFHDAPEKWNKFGTCIGSAEKRFENAAQLENHFYPKQNVRRSSVDVLEWIALQKDRS